MCTLVTGVACVVNLARRHGDTGASKHSVEKTGSATALRPRTEPWEGSDHTHGSERLFKRSEAWGMIKYGLLSSDEQAS